MHKVIVKKFGGTSVATEEARLKCIEHIKSNLQLGEKVIVVLSAMGREGDPYATDTLLSLIDQNRVGDKEKDLLMSTGEIISSVVFSDMLNKQGITNKVLTGSQAGILTNGKYNQSLIEDIKTEGIEAAINSNQVVIIPGFQGVDSEGNVTTLGRGGSDTSAVAIAVAMNAYIVEIFTDVEGLMSADPRVVKEPNFMERISYEEVCQLAYNGAKVIHPRAVEIAKKNNLKMRIRSTFSDNPGTMIASSESEQKIYDVKENMLAGVTSTKDIVHFEIFKNERLQSYSLLFEILKNERISIDFINVGISKAEFTVSNKDSIKLKSILNDLSLDYVVTEEVSKVAIIGNAINGVPGVMSDIMESMIKEAIDVYQTADSNNTIWLLVDEANSKSAVNALHNKFFA